MTVSKVSISETSIDKLVNYLIQKLRFDYENHCTNISVLASEDFYFRNMSAQLNMIILKKEGTCILIDVIGGGGGTGLLNINWGSELSFTKKVRKVLVNYTEEFGLAITDHM